MTHRAHWKHDTLLQDGQIRWFDHVNVVTGESEREPRMGCTRLYMKAGPSNAPKYFPVHEIRVLLSIDLVDTLLAFHAMTGCLRYTAWSRLIHATKNESGYCVSVVHKRLCHQSEMQQHFTSCVHTTKQLSGTKHTLPPVTEMGWMHLDGRLVPRLLSLSPIPKVCREITSCGCTKGCLSQRCSCWKLGDN